MSKRFILISFPIILLLGIYFLGPEPDRPVWARTIALVLAATYPDDVFALINLSPNIELNNPAAWLLNDPWGLQIARRVFGSDYKVEQYDAPRLQYWYSRYRLEALTQLQELIEDK